MEHQIPEKLQQAIQENKLVLFIGAGFSAGLGFPTWNQLVEQILQKACTDEDDRNWYLQGMKKGRTSALDVLDDFENNKSEACSVLESALGLSDDIRAKIAADEKYQLVWQLSPRIVTTNYDKSLEVAGKLEATDVVPYHVRNGIAQLVHKPRYLLKIHGDLADSAECVLFRSQYQALYGAETSAIFELKRLYADSTLLFVGFSLSDPYVTEIFAYMQKLYEGYKGKQHFVLSCNDNDFSSFGVENISLNAYSEIPAYLKQLLPYKPSTPPAPTPLPPADDIRAVVLVSQPIGEQNQYHEALTALKKITCPLDILPLNQASLNKLDDYQYLFILSRSIKGNIQIESEFLEARNLPLATLCEQIAMQPCYGIFMLLDEAITPTDAHNLQLPLALFSQTDKTTVESMLFKAFKKQTLPDSAQVFNAAAWQFKPLTGKAACQHTISPYAKEISKTELANFVGRNTDLKNIVRNLIQLPEQNGILTIKGSGGIGKTASIKKAALLLAERQYFSEGIFFIDCEFLSEFSLFRARVLDVFGLGSAQDALQHLDEYQNKADRLIILDNFETLLNLGHTSQFIELVNTLCEHASIVITSRQLLQQSWEHAYELSRMSTDEAEALFIQANQTGQKLSSHERKLLREDILETLLDNNPLAIKLLTRNLPKGKNLATLRDELIQDIFYKVSEEDLASFDAASDNNIERKRSLYGCINYSYNLLNPKEKLAFEVLSLFPDGISLENLQQVSKQNKDPLARPMISDTTIKGLQDKSMLESHDGHMKLQSIMGKFAEHKLAQRSDIEHIYQNLFSYNQAIAEIYLELIDKNENLAQAFGASQQNNWLACFKTCSKFAFEPDELARFIEKISGSFIYTCQEQLLLAVIQEQASLFSVDSLLLHQTTLVRLNYYRGQFQTSYRKLQELIPEASLPVNQVSKLHQLAIYDAIAIYEMEGNALLSLRQRLAWNAGDQYYPSELFHLGEYDVDLLALTTLNFSSFQVSFNQQQGKLSDLQNYLNALHKKAHLQRMQLTYIKVKAGKFNLEEVKRLVVVNPYTQGLKYLMLALNQPDVGQAKELFQQALPELAHIKYYYTEAFYLYAQFLQQQGDEQFQEIYQQGLALAQQYYYRFLIYQFEGLLQAKTQPYCSDDYPLPDEMARDVKAYLHLCIKELKK